MHSFPLISALLMTIIPNLQEVDRQLLKNWIEQAKPEVISEGHQFTEGPCWIPGMGLVFSDVPANKQYLWNEKDGTTVFRDPSGFANGNLLTPDGFLITAQHDRTVTKVHPGKEDTRELIAVAYDAKKLNSPNDLALHSSGALYFTDPMYGLIGFGPQKAPEEQEVRGIYKLAPNGTLERVASALEIPNGLAFTPDEKHLIVSNSADGNLYRFQVREDGSLGYVSVFAVQSVPEGGTPNGDGLTIDADGNVWAASSGAVSVYSPAGELLGQIPLPGHVSNLSFGGEDNRTLFVTATDKVYRLTLPE